MILFIRKGKVLQNMEKKLRFRKPVEYLITFIFAIFVILLVSIDNFEFTFSSVGFISFLIGGIILSHKLLSKYGHGNII